MMTPRAITTKVQQAGQNPLELEQTRKTKYKANINNLSKKEAPKKGNHPCCFKFDLTVHSYAWNWKTC